MSCEHGNHPDACDECDALEAAYKRGYEAAKATQPAATGAGDGLERFLIQNLLKYMTIVDDRNDVWSHWQGVRVSVKQLATEYLGDTK